VVAPDAAAPVAPSVSRPFPEVVSVPWFVQVKLLVAAERSSVRVTVAAPATVAVSPVAWVTVTPPPAALSLRLTASERVYPSVPVRVLAVAPPSGPAEEVLIVPESSRVTVSPPAADPASWKLQLTLLTSLTETPSSS
jgi:hypothetical protein